MMRNSILWLFLVLTGCGGSLSDEQREAFREEMDNREIRKVSEEQIFDKAFELGKGYVRQLEKNKSSAVARKNAIRVRFADSTASGLPEKYKGIWEAYFHAPAGTALEDNVQQYNDTLIYSSAVVKNGELKGVWLIDIPKKNIVLAL